jgi:ATP-binding cassette subfamily B multidrug efflux pump
MSFEIIALDRLPPDRALPRRLGAFVWYFMRQIKFLLLTLLILDAGVAGLASMIPVMLGWLANDINTATRNPAMALDPLLISPWLLTIGLPVLLGWGLCMTSVWYLYDHHFGPRFNNIIRYQLARYTLGHSMAYFANDFAGRIANKVLEGGPAMRDPLRSAISSVWYCAFFVSSCIGLMLASNVWLALPALIWLALYIWTLWLFVPQIRARALRHSRVHTRLVGHVNDTYANILSVKLFARERNEEAINLAILEEHSGAARILHHKIWQIGALHVAMNVALLAATPAIALTLWSRGAISAGAVIMVLPMVWQMVNQSGWIRAEVNSIVEALSRVEECMETIAKPYSVVDAPNAKPLVTEPGGGAVTFANVNFHYGRPLAEHESGVLHSLSLHIPAGQRVGLVGRSGAGKSTLVSLLLRFYDLESGVIAIDDQDISRVTQHSLRQHIAMVTQDSSLLHRSIADNIRYGNPDASMEQVIAAATRAHAHDFILTLEDRAGRRGYEAHVGERGVKLSGGQRQRIAIARVILEDAPILILDEATSALDSEVEAAIQQEMATLMQGKTTIAIAHRLSTIAQMDRLIVMDHGRIVEDGTHAKLLASGGLYAQLWRRQSGGFLGE